jgi:hypothetical protein
MSYREGFMPVQREERFAGENDGSPHSEPFGITSAVDQLDEDLRQLADEIAHLAEVLKPILRSSITVAANKAEMASKPATEKAPLLGHLEDCLALVIMRRQELINLGERINL